MSRISLVSGSLKPRQEPTPEQLQAFLQTIETIEIPGVDLENVKDFGVFKVSRSFKTNEDNINANSGDFASKIAQLTQELSRTGLELKGELVVVTEAFKESPAMQHISVCGTHVVKTSGVASWTGQSSQVYA